MGGRGGNTLNDKLGHTLGREAALLPLVATFSEGGGEEDLDCPDSSISRPSASFLLFPFSSSSIRFSELVRIRPEDFGFDWGYFTSGARWVRS